MKEGNESYMVWIRDWTFLVVYYTGYQNSRLVHNNSQLTVQAFADNVVAPHLICSKPQPQVPICHNIPKRSRVHGNKRLYHEWTVVWLLMWIGVSSAGRNRLAKIENKVDDITNTATSVNELKPSYFLFHSSKPPSAHALKYWLFSRIEWHLYKKKHGPGWAVAGRKRSQ